MTDEIENEFTQYKQKYEELKARVERLGQYDRMMRELRARMGDLSPQVEELDEELQEGETEIGWESRACERCGDPFVSHSDQALCHACQEAGS